MTIQSGRSPGRPRKDPKDKSREELIEEALRKQQRKSESEKRRRARNKLKQQQQQQPPQQLTTTSPLSPPVPASFCIIFEPPGDGNCAFAAISQGITPINRIK